MHAVVRQRSKVSAVNASVVADDVFGPTGKTGLTGPITKLVVGNTQAVIHTCGCRSECISVDNTLITGGISGCRFVESLYTCRAYVVRFPIESRLASAIQY